MLGPSVLDGDEVAAGGHGRVDDLVALRALLAVHLHLGRPVDGHRESAGAGVTRVHDELGGHA